VIRWRISEFVVVVGGYSGLGGCYGGFCLLGFLNILECSWNFVIFVSFDPLLVERERD
jgi:hypothetical protein